MVSKSKTWYISSDCSSLATEQQPSEEPSPPPSINTFKEQASIPSPQTSSTIELEHIASQFRAAASCLSSSLSKIIMVELERRLERRDRCQGFSTYLAGILLLNCVERLCWCLRSAHENLTASDQDVRATNWLFGNYIPQDSADDILTSHRFIQLWPSEKPIDYFLTQSSQFAAFLSKLFKMRGILLQIRPEPGDEDGILGTNSDMSPLADQWLRELKLTSKTSFCKLGVLNITPCLFVSVPPSIRATSSPCPLSFTD